MELWGNVRLLVYTTNTALLSIQQFKFFPPKFILITIRGLPFVYSSHSHNNFFPADKWLVIPCLILDKKGDNLTLGTCLKLFNIIFPNTRHQWYKSRDIWDIRYKSWDLKYKIQN